MEAGAGQQAAPGQGSRPQQQPVKGVELLQHLLHTPVDFTVKMEKGEVAAAEDGSRGEEAWLLCFCNSSVHLAHDAAELLYADSGHAEQVVPILASFALAPYSLPAEMLACKAPHSLSGTTTSRRLLNYARHPADITTAPQLTVGLGGSAACAAALELVGITRQSLFASPRLLVELHLPDLETAVLLVLPRDRQALLGGRGGSVPPPPQLEAHVLPEKILPPPGASKYTASEAHCHCCQASAGVKLKTCQRCGVARYCSKDCQAKDWPEHRPVCRPLADYKARMQAGMREAQQELLAPEHGHSSAPGSQSVICFSAAGC